MGNQHSTAQQSTSPSQKSAAGIQQNQPGGSQSKPKSARSSRYSQFRLFHPSALATTSSVSASGTPSDASPSTTYDYPLTPSTSISPSVTRVETQHHYNHKHGSSLDSYVAGEQTQQQRQHHHHHHHFLFQPTSPAPTEQDDYFFKPSAPIDMGAASSSEKLPRRQPSTRDRPDSGSPHSSPLNVPARSRSQRQREGGGAGGREGTPHNENSPGLFKPPGPPPDGQQQMAYRERDSVSSVSSSYAGAQPMFTHPPRLPLPIQEEELAPGSPVIPPIETDSDLDVRGLVPNQSILSSQNGEDEDEDEEPDDRADEALDQQDSGSRRWTVPTEVVWHGQADKIYVTGTFANWSKKFRMGYNPDSETARVTLDLVPGTHHLRFIVDGEMKLSRDLPTAVDWTNTLVNYIEVSADASLRHRRHGRGGEGEVEDGGHRTASVGHGDPLDHTGSQQAAHTKPLSDGTWPAAGATATGAEGTTRTGAPHIAIGGSGSGSRGPSEASVPASGSGSNQASADKDPSAGPELMDLPPRHYGQAIPGYLSDLDRDEKSARFARASSRVSDMAAPPTLPGFLVRSILNMVTPSKDDASVLNMPNHTMLNHLATSSIRHGVLATSLTTRYKRKYVTLITYRPTTMDEA